MANVVTGNPFLIDTATDTAIVASGQIFKLYALAWTSASIADGLSVQDAAGTVKYSDIQDVTNKPHTLNIPDECPLIFNGLKVPTLTTGTLKLYVKLLK